jgi:hypothetical protein
VRAKPGLTARIGGFVLLANCAPRDEPGASKIVANHQAGTEARANVELAAEPTHARHNDDNDVGDALPQPPRSTQPPAKRAHRRQFRIHEPPCVSSVSNASLAASPSGDRAAEQQPDRCGRLGEKRQPSSRGGARLVSALGREVGATPHILVAEGEQGSRGRSRESLALSRGLRSCRARYRATQPAHEAGHCPAIRVIAAWPRRARWVRWLMSCPFGPVPGLLSLQRLNVRSVARSEVGRRCPGG